MKTKRFLSLLLTLAVLTGLCVIPTSAVETEEVATTEIEIFIENEDISEETRAKIIAYYSDPNHENDGIATCGLTCTLFGHKLEDSVVRSVTHKVRSTAPRCLEKTYTYEACTRCDYENSTLLGSSYIFCCS
ncbi:MAG: hypothetical protein J6A49_08045 [Clostridia bacterium]|nr:hypothetical protein [Clostridia bacterium]